MERASAAGPVETGYLVPPEVGRMEGPGGSGEGQGAIAGGSAAGAGNGGRVLWTGPSGRRGSLLYLAFVRMTSRSPPPRWVVERWGPIVSRLWRRANQLEEKYLMMRFRSRRLPLVGVSNVLHKKRVLQLYTMLRKVLRWAQKAVVRIEEDTERAGEPAFGVALRRTAFRSAMRISDEAWERAQEEHGTAERPVYVADSEEEQEVVNLTLKMDQGHAQASGKQKITSKGHGQVCSAASSSQGQAQVFLPCGHRVDNLREHCVTCRAHFVVVEEAARQV